MSEQSGPSDQRDRSAQLRVGAASDVGRVRTTNEDSMLRDDEGGIFAVADGMGGHRAGDIASATALETFGARTSAGDPIADAIHAANSAVFEKAQANPEMRGMGTTVTAMKVEGANAHMAHVGDSRAYLLRDGDLTQVTDDHSLVEELVREGRLTPEEAAVHPQRSIITRALGVDESIEVDTYDIDLRVGDRLVICSDGLTSMVHEDAIVAILRSEQDPQQAADELVEAANVAGGEDNITVLVVDVDGLSEAEPDPVAAGEAVAGSVGLEATGEWERPPGLDDEVPDDRHEPAAPTARGRLRRLAVWVVPLLVLVIVTAAALGWYARRTYFVGLDDDQVALFRGVPGGFLVWNPTLEDLSDLIADDLTAADRAKVRDGHQFSGRREAEDFIAQMERKATTTTTTTTTTVPEAEP